MANIINWSDPETKLDQASKDTREAVRENAERKLKELQKKDDRFNDPMNAYKFLKEMEICQL